MSKPTIDELLAEFEEHRGAPLPPATRALLRRVGPLMLALSDRDLDIFIARLKKLASA
jgi:hypothetical protein